MLIIYHNPRCSKSRQTLKIIEDSQSPVEIIKYLEQSPNKKELKEVLQKLDAKAIDIVRKTETIYKENYKNKSFSDDEWLTILVENPKLIERPIVFNNTKAIIGRPPENVNQLLD